MAAIVQNNILSLKKKKMMKRRKKKKKKKKEKERENDNHDNKIKQQCTKNSRIIDSSIASAAIAFKFNWNTGRHWMKLIGNSVSKYSNYLNSSGHFSHQYVVILFQSTA